MSTRTITSRKSCGTVGERLDDVVLREPLDDASRRPGRAGAPRAGCRGSSRPPPSAACRGARCSRRPRSMLRFVRIRSSQARRFVPGRVRAPAPERARVGLLDEVLGLLAARHEAPRDPVDLVGEPERLLLEADAVACLGAPGGGRRSRPLPSHADTNTRNRTGPSAIPGPFRRGAPFSRRGIGTRRGERRDDLLPPDRSSSQESVTWPMRFAFADSSPSSSPSAPPSRMTQRSQRIPLTWSVSDRNGHAAIVAALAGPRHGMEGGRCRPPSPGGAIGRRPWQAGGPPAAVLPARAPGSARPSEASPGEAGPAEAAV